MRLSIRYLATQVITILEVSKKCNSSITTSLRAFLFIFLVKYPTQGTSFIVKYDQIPAIGRKMMTKRLQHDVENTNFNFNFIPDAEHSY